MAGRERVVDSRGGSVVVAAKGKKKAKGSEWSWRLAGFALCAFFALGVATGLSGGGHQLAQHIIGLWPSRLPDAGPASSSSSSARLESAATSAAGAKGGDIASLALVQRGDGFYALDAAGSLRGPVSFAGENDMPILSGPAVANADAARLLDFASIVVRAEAALGRAISQLQCETPDNGVIYLDRPPVPITIDFNQAPYELARASQVLALWRGHSDLIAALDMTVPGQAVLRLRPAALRVSARALPQAESRVRNSGPEVTASR